MNISEFERNKPVKTYRAIKNTTKKYKNVIKNMEMMDDDDCTRVEMANDFIKDLEKIMEVFQSGE
ncbi:MAG: hypothetical protein CMN79_03590 [Spirochaetales bacterium]|jgi:ABC-type proline/glycine betaine transport system substrate-binding protein|nr:hypothetical protein [Spirochaetales bacterium]|tara:strand:+ start:333 stop:527 length:195 start_codon:yes stop_codon:yes gene_type:complete